MTGSRVGRKLRCRVRAARCSSADERERLDAQRDRLRELAEDLDVLLARDAPSADHDGRGRAAGLVRATATQTSSRRVLSGTMASQSSRLNAGDRAGVAGAEHAVGDPAGETGRAAAADRSRLPGDAAILRSWPSGISRISTAGTEKIRRGAGRRRRGQPVEGLGGVDVQGHAGQRGQHGRRPLRALPGPRVAQHGRHRGEQFRGLGGLDQVGVGALGQAVSAVGDLDGGGGHLDHRDRGRPRVRLDPAGRPRSRSCPAGSRRAGPARPRRCGPAPPRPVADLGHGVTRPAAARWPGGSAWPRRRRPAAECRRWARSSGAPARPAGWRTPAVPW